MGQEESPGARAPRGFTTERTRKARDRASSPSRATLGDPVVDDRVVGKGDSEGRRSRWRLERGAEGKNRPRRERCRRPNRIIGA